MLRHLRRPAAALRRRRWCVRRAARAAAWPASGSPPATRSPGSAPSTRRRPRARWSSPPPARRPRLPGTEPGAVKVTPFTEYPAKGRATGGVRCHRFLKGEDALVFAWVGTAPARAAAASGAPVDLPEADRAPRRLRGPRQPADRGLRRTGRRRGCPPPCGRLNACASCSPGSPSPGPASPGRRRPRRDHVPRRRPLGVQRRRAGDGGGADDPPTRCWRRPRPLSTRPAACRSR